MDYYTLGNTGLRVSRLALGTMTFGTVSGWGSDEAEARRIFARYVEAGGNFFDTADLYTAGTSEEWLGRFVREAGLRDRAVIASKFGFNGDPGNPNAGGAGRKNVMRAVENSLRRLGTDYLDLYYVHCWDGFTPVDELMRSFEDLVRSGKVRHVGLSDVPAWYAGRGDAIAELRGWERPAVLQLEYSLVERGIEDEFVPMARTLGIGILAWSPLGSGLLSGKYRRDGAEIQGAGRLATLRGSGNPAFEKFNDRNWAIVTALEDVADELKRSMAQVAINWVAHRPGVAGVIVGATRLEQLEDDLGALDFELPTDLRARLDVASARAVAFPYTFFEQGIQARLTGDCRVSNRPSSFDPPHRITPPEA